MAKTNPGRAAPTPPDDGPGTGPLSAPARLDAEEVSERLAALPEWTRNGDAIQRTLRFENFLAAMAFVERIAKVAEAQQHHPDILIRYNKVTLTLSTHDAGGITGKDFILAEAIERLRRS